MLTEVLLFCLSFFTNPPAGNTEPRIVIRESLLYINHVQVSAGMPKDSVLGLLGPCVHKEKKTSSFTRGGECGLSRQKIVEKRRIFHFEKGITLEQDRVSGKWECLKIPFSQRFSESTGRLRIDGIDLSGQFSLDDRRQFLPAWESGSDSLHWYSMKSRHISHGLIFSSDRKLKEAVFLF